MRVAIFDTDTLIYAAASNSETSIQWTPELFTLHSDLDRAYDLLRRDIDRIMKEMKADVEIHCFTNYEYEKRWRFKIMPDYKDTREGRKPVVYFPLRERLSEEYTTFEISGLEGDDVVGVLLTRDDFYPKAAKIAVSLDKDMNTIPGFHLNYNDARKTGWWEPRLISEEEADRYHMLQTLTGDRVDGYSGCPGIGPVRGNRILDEGEGPADWWRLVVETYEDKGLTEEDALMNARVSRILRSEDWDREKKEVRLWTPPTDSKS